MRKAKYNPEKWTGDLPEEEFIDTKKSMARGKRSHKSMAGKGKRSYEIVCIQKDGKVMIG